MARSFGENSLAPVGLRCRRERLPLSGYAASRMRKFGDFAAKGGGEVLGARSLALQSARGRLQKTLAARVGALGRRVLAGFSRVCVWRPVESPVSYDLGRDARGLEPPQKSDGMDTRRPERRSLLRPLATAMHSRPRSRDGPHARRPCRRLCRACQRTRTRRWAVVTPPRSSRATNQRRSSWPDALWRATQRVSGSSAMRTSYSKMPSVA